MKDILNMTGQAIVLQTADGKRVTLPAAAIANPAKPEQQNLKIRLLTICLP